MELLEFARGPALVAALAVFFAGTGWRLYAVLRRPRKPDLSLPRSTGLAAGAWRGVWIRMLPRKALGRPGFAATLNAYAYHIGIAIVVLAFLPHIAFIERLTGLRWPALPDWVTYLATAVAIITLTIALVNRLTNGVLRLLSNFDDYFSWLVTMAPFVTGMALIERPYVPAPIVAPPLPTQPELLALHLFTLELLLVWFPFGKLAHALLAFASRARTGAEFTRKGAAL
jgi:nitrate reductase gamma subunit